MIARPCLKVTLIIRRPALDAIIEQIRRTSVIAIMSADAMTALEPAKLGTDVAVPAVMETSCAVCVETVGHVLNGDVEAEMFSVRGDALLVRPVDGAGVVDGSIIAFGERGGCCGGDEGCEEKDVVVHLDWFFVGLVGRFRWLRDSRLWEQLLRRSGIRYEGLLVLFRRD